MQQPTQRGTMYAMANLDAHDEAPDYECNDISNPVLRFVARRSPVTVVVFLMLSIWAFLYFLQACVWFYNAVNASH